MNATERELPFAETADLPCVICDKPLGPTGSRSHRDSEAAHSACAHPPDTREVRVCKWGCGYERLVKVSRHWAGGKTFREDFNEYCTACEALASAANHEKTARDLRKKAESIITARRVKAAGK